MFTMPYKRCLLITIVFIALAFIAANSPADTPSVPASCTYKVTSTPDFFQEDPRGNFPNGGKDICAPTSISDSFLYLATHGFGRLLPPSDPPGDQAQINLINTLGSPRYLNNDPQSDGTSPSDFLWGVRRYVTDCGYVCKRLEYMGSQALGLRTASAKIGSVPDINWIKAAVANPNCCVWLRLGYYARGSKPGQWTKTGKHTVAVVGYETGSQKNAIPTELLIHNPDRQLGNPPSTPATMLTDDVVYLSPLQSGELDNPFISTSTNAAGIYRLWGPGLLRNKRGVATILDGAVVLEIAKPGAGS